MQIEDTINKWSDKTWALLQKKDIPKCRIDIMILGALPIIDNYLNSALLILNKGSKLPAMALLRSTGELFTKIIYCLKGNNADDQEERLRRWEKHSLIERRKLYEKFLKRYQQNNNQAKIAEAQGWIDQTKDEISKINVKSLPKNQDIFIDVFDKSHPVGQEGFYHFYLSASHVDLETIGKTIQNDEYIGDCNFDIKDLKFECLTLLYYFLQEIYNHYKLNSQEINDDYDKCLQSTFQRINN